MTIEMKIEQLHACQVSGKVPMDTQMMDRKRKQNRVSHQGRLTFVFFPLSFRPLD